MYAYYHYGHMGYHHGGGLGGWLAETVARSLIYREVWALTRGMRPLGIGVLLILALAVMWAMSRR
jgi:hypothetical protein